VAVRICLERKFLLGLTATPERTDGPDLLRLCGDNLVYRADMAVRGVPEGGGGDYLRPFQYPGRRRWCIRARTRSSSPEFREKDAEGEPTQEEPPDELAHLHP